MNGGEKLFSEGSEEIFEIRSRILEEKEGK